MVADQEQRILIAYTGRESQPQHNNEALDMKSFLLPCPKTGRPQAYMLSGSQLCEVQHFKCMYSAWMLDDKLMADGGMYMATPVDPLLVLLPVMDKARNKSADSPAGVFRALEEVMAEGAAAWPGLGLLAPLVKDTLALVCDTREVCEEVYYRLSAERVLAWLRVKADITRRALAVQLTGMDDSSQLSYVVGFLAEYLADSWVSALSSALGVDASGCPMGSGVQGEARLDVLPGQPPEKKQRVDPKELAREAARRRAEEARQVVLAKQAAGTKKISAFFAPKPKS